MSRIRLAALCAGLGLLPTTIAAQQELGHLPMVTTPKLVVEVEGGPAWQSYNDVRIPNDATATRFSLVDLVGTGPAAAGRVYVTWNTSERNGWRVLIAPFSFSASGVLDRPIGFAGTTFQAGHEARATYTFNSYRLTWRHRFHAGERTTAWVGFTAKLRDATIALEQGTIRARKDDLGFVPLLHLAADWELAPRWRLDLDVDALAGGPGRAEDATIRVGWDLGDHWTLRAGYRMVEGGADVDAVYTFAWLHYAVVSVAWRR
jgi:hypothetical protein